MMKTIQTLFFAAGILSFAACKTSNEEASTVASSIVTADGKVIREAVATVTFPKDFSAPVVKGTMTRGGKIWILYAQARKSTFKKCGSDLKFIGVTPNWKVDDGPTLPLASGELGTRADMVIEGEVYNVLTLTLPKTGDDLALWFIAANRYGQCETDDQKSANYHFDLK